MNQFRQLFSVSLISLAAVTIGGCGSSSTSKGATAGAIVGGLVDGWSGAAWGAVIGGGIGQGVDRAESMKRRDDLKERDVARRERESAYRYTPPPAKSVNSNPLTGSTWRVISLVDEENPIPEFASIVISFQTNTKATTLILWKDGKSETYGESYTVVGDALIFTGKNYVTNSKYTINNKQMLLVTPTIRAVLQEVEEGV